MDNKKKYFIVIILVIFVFLMVFAFANPKNNSEKKSDGNNTSEKADGEKDKTDSDSEDETLLTAEEQKEEEIQVIQNWVVRNNDEEEARRLVLEAEASADDTHVYDKAAKDAAQKAVDKLPNGQLKDLLQERLNIIDEGLDLQGLINKLEEMVESAKKTLVYDDMAEARNNDTTGEFEALEKRLEDFIDTAGHSSVEAKLRKQMDELLPYLRDTDKPTINIDNGTILNTEQGKDVEINDEGVGVAKVTINGETFDEPYTLPKDEGKYTISVVDAACNESIITIVVDNTAPKIVLDKLLENNLTNDKDLTITDANNFTSKIEKAGKTVKENIASDKQEDGTYYDRYGVFSGDGEYTVSATDAAGNTSSVTFTYDSTKPTGEVAVQKKDNPESKTAKRGDWLVFTVTFDEALSTTPTLTVGGNTGNVVKVDGKTYTYEVNLPAGLPDGKVPFTVSNIVDLAGNKGKDVTKVTDGTWLEVDNTPIKLNAKEARVYGTNNNSKNTLAKMGDRIQIVLDVQEELKTMPTLVINGEKIEFVPTAGTEGSHHVYEANYTVKDGEDDAIVEYQIINLQDEAGNGLEGVEGTTITNESFNEMKYDFTTPQLKGVPGSKHTNKDVTVTVEDVNPYTLTAKNRDNKETYTSADGKTLTLTEEGLYDITATDKAGNSSDKVQMRMDKTPITVNFFHAYAIGENNTSGDTLAKAKDTIQVVLHTKEKLAKLPELWIDGEKVGNFRHVEDQDTNDNKVYAASYYIREASPEKDNEIINYEVKGLTDQSGNGVTYKKAENTHELTYANANTIRYDFTNPKIVKPTVNEEGYANSKRIEAEDKNAFTTNVEFDGKVQNSKSNQSYQYGDINRYTYGVWNGDGTYTVTATDAAGNKTTVTYTLDTKNIEVNHITPHIEGTNNVSNNTVAKIGDKVYFVLDAKEELEILPVLEINGEKIEFHVTAGWSAGHYVYAASYIVPESVKDKDGQAIEYKITNLVDKAGNGTNYNGKKVTELSNKDFANMKYDFTAPTAHNVQFQEWNTKNVVVDKTMYVTKGSQVAVITQFDELLPVNPVFTIAGVNQKTVSVQEQWNTYTAAVVIPEDYDLESGSEVPFSVVAQDAAGNQVTFTEFDPENKNLPNKLVLDTEAPSLIVDGVVYSPNTEGTINAITPIKSNGEADGSATFSGVDELSGYAGLVDGSSLKPSFRKDAHPTYVYPIKTQDKLGNTHTYKVYIIKNTTQNIESSLKNITDNSTLTLPKSEITGSFEIDAKNVTIKGVEGSKINGQLKIAEGADGATLENVNLSNNFASVVIAADNVTIDGGNFTTMSESLNSEGKPNGVQGEGAIRVYKEDTEHHLLPINGVTIKNTVLHGGIFLGNITGDIEISGNIINMDYEGTTVLPGINITSENPENYSAQELYSNNTFNWAEANKPYSYYVMVQDNSWHLIDSVKISDAPAKAANNAVVAADETDEADEADKADETDEVVGDPATPEEDEVTPAESAPEVASIQEVYSTKEFPHFEEAYEEVTTETTYTEETVTISSSNDAYYQNYLKEHNFQPKNVIWWVQFTCDEEMCEGFDERATGTKNSMIIEGRRGDIETITMTAPKAKEGYHFVKWVATTVKYSGVEMQGYKAVYEKDAE